MASFATESQYGSLFDNKGPVFGVGDDGVRLADVVFAATKCEPNDRYKCILSKVFVFAVPQKGGEHSWRHQGADYTVLEQGDVLVFGQRFQYRRIRQEWAGNVVEYVYSDARGVIAIRAANGNQLLLMGGCGFAAIDASIGCK